MKRTYIAPVCVAAPMLPCQPVAVSIAVSDQETTSNFQFSTKQESENTDWDLPF